MYERILYGALPIGCGALGCDASQARHGGSKAPTRKTKRLDAQRCFFDERARKRASKLMMNCCKCSHPNDVAVGMMLRAMLCENVGALLLCLCLMGCRPVMLWIIDISLVMNSITIV